MSSTVIFTKSLFSIVFNPCMKQGFNNICLVCCRNVIDTSSKFILN